MFSIYHTILIIVVVIIMRTNDIHGYVKEDNKKKEWELSRKINLNKEDDADDDDDVLICRSNLALSIKENWEGIGFEIWMRESLFWLELFFAKFRHSVEKKNLDLWLGYCLFGFSFKLTKNFLASIESNQNNQFCVTCR